MPGRIGWHFRRFPVEQEFQGKIFSTITSGGQIEWKPETLLRFQTAAPFTTTIFKKNGVQIQLPAAPGPALKVRAINE
jgi:hypothetical protein